MELLLIFFFIVLIFTLKETVKEETLLLKHVEFVMKQCLIENAKYSSKYSFMKRGWLFKSMN